MKKILTLAASLALLTTVNAFAQSTNAPQADAAQGAHTTLTPNGSQPSLKGPEQYFTGNARIDMLFPVSEATNVSGAYVTFEPGARSAWHTHPAGQTLIVMAGLGWTQEWGGPIQEIRPGDVLICPPGVKHWHGASPTTAMTHLTVTGDLDGKNVEWLEKVSDEQYQK